MHDFKNIKFKLFYMKKAIKFLIFAAALAIFGSALTSCTSEETETVIYSYTANGNISATNDPGATFIIPEFNQEIQNVLGGVNYSLTEMDSEVIAACDAMYERAKAEHPGAQGEITINKNTSTTDNPHGEDTTLRTYTF